jgi:hypothetical protein
LEKFDGIAAFHGEPAHVADIEEPGSHSNGLVFVHDP